jgi:serine/threonine protein kinase
MHGAVPSSEGTQHRVGRPHQTLWAAQAPVPTGIGLPPGQRVAGYELLRELGRGGMGVVYLARQESLNRLVALKMILTGGHAGSEILERFQTEARAVAQLQHPNIVQIYEVDTADGLPFCALEFLAGGSLADRLNGAPLAPMAATALLEVVARAVAFTHERGIVHRDLKPANVLLRPKDASALTDAEFRPEAYEPVLTDFGLAKNLRGDSKQTRSGALLGTPSYMAPEQAKGQIVGPPADIYALGAVLYDLLTGRPPFRGESVVDTLNLVQHTEPVPPRRLQPRVPWDVQTICLKCLEKDPARRYASAQELADDLRRCVVGEPIRARPTSFTIWALKWARSRPTLTALLLVSVALIASLAVGGTAFLLYYQQQAAFLQRALVAADAERQRADVERQRGREVLATTVQAVRSIIGQVGDHVGRADLLRTAEERCEQLVTVAGDDPAFLPEQAAARGHLGTIQFLNGRYSVARATLRLALERWDQALQMEGLEAPRRERFRYEHAVCEHRLGVTQAALADPAAGPTLGRAYDTLLDLPVTVLITQELARLCADRAAWLTEQGDWPAAEKLLEQACERWQQLDQARPHDRDLRQAWADALVQLGSVQRQRDRMAEAKATLNAAVSLLESANQGGGGPFEQLILARGCAEQAQLLPEVPGLWQQAERRFRQLVQQQPREPDFRHALAQFRSVSARAGGADPHAALTEVITLRKQLLSELPDHPGYRAELGRAYLDLGQHLAEQRAGAPAETAFATALATLAPLLDTAGDGLGRRTQADVYRRRAEWRVAEYRAQPTAERRAAADADWQARIALWAGGRTRGQAQHDYADWLLSTERPAAGVTLLLAAAGSYAEERATQDGALAVLRRVAQLAPESVATWATDPRLTPLRTRADFQQLLAGGK